MILFIFKNQDFLNIVMINDVIAMQIAVDRSRQNGANRWELAVEMEPYHFEGSYNSDTNTYNWNKIGNIVR